ncbi:hypothetical protein AVEN_75677-1 [Araneus ventricosus]|uniref:Transposase Tc1-like domain-containing protein n=1 Tax=Araneus ventricosus TaxID=182803 RepID=A0A4Y2D4U7_ARAVE|nr:hypothetical protein AVEN_75677-1 [Araneus ventricosus]
MISTKNRKARVEWAKAHKDWKKKECEDVLLSDESKYFSFGTDGIQWKQADAYCFVQLRILEDHCCRRLLVSLYPIRTKRKYLLITQRTSSYSFFFQSLAPSIPHA